MRPRGIFGIIIMVSISILISPITAIAAHTVDVITLDPATDGGKYITTQQSKTLPQLGFNVGLTFDYGWEPFERVNTAGGRVIGIVDDLAVGNLHGAIGITDWMSAGANLPVALWETYRDFLVAGAAKVNKYGKFGDARFEMKFKLVDIERYHIGVAVVPFIYFPTGQTTYRLGNGMFSPGGTLVVDWNIKDRVEMALNFGYRNYRYDKWAPNDPNGIIDDTVRLGGGINVKINDSFAVLGEVWAEPVMKSLFSMSGQHPNQTQSPSEFLIGGRYTPQETMKGLGITVAAGRSILRGVGSPDFRGLIGVNFKRDYSPEHIPETDLDIGVQEKIVITQKIHFEFSSAKIRSVSLPILDDVAYLLFHNPQIRSVRVEGHSDWIGPDSSNQRLSEQRARAVRDYLVSKGIEPDRLESAGYGESRPISDNNTVEGRARNRRTEFTVVQ